MSYIKFDKEKLVNLEFALNKEMIRADRGGSYASTTIIECNTRKYHGLLVAPQPAIDGDNHVIISSINETIVQNESSFNLGIHRFPSNYYPRGHKYITSFVSEPIPKITYQLNQIVFTKERLFSHEGSRVFIRYKLEDCSAPIKLRINPFLAFRNVHKLSKANNFVDKNFEKIANGVKMRMYTGYSYLHLQFSKDVEYVHSPDWWYNFEYAKEKERGYDYHEDLYVPGFFEFEIEKGEIVIFSASLNEVKPLVLKRMFNQELKKRVPRDSFENNLLNSAQQFIVRKPKKTEIIAGYPWFGRWGRDTFIALPGLTLVTKDFKTAKQVIDTMLEELDGPLFPNIGESSHASYNSVDASLWFFWALQQYAIFTETKHKIWKEYGKKMKMILEGYRNGTLFNIHKTEQGLIWAGEQGKALTWMDAVVAGKAVTPRIGMPVEINALWYNAIMFSIEVAQLWKDVDFVNEWKSYAEQFPSAFKSSFWSDEKGYLADCISNDYKDWSVRPNMIFAVSLPYSPLDDEQKHLVLKKIRKELLTSRGLRTLSPKNPDYKGVYEGNQAERDAAYHQGTVWPWLIGHYAEARLKVYGKSALQEIKELYSGFEPAINEYCIGSIAEIYDGDPPHAAKGALSQAWSVAEILRMKYLIDYYENIDL